MKHKATFVAAEDENTTKRLRMRKYCSKHHATPEASRCPSVTCLMCMLVSQVKGRAEVRSLLPNTVEMMPLRSTFRIMVPSTK